VYTAPGACKKDHSACTNISGTSATTATLEECAALCEDDATCLSLSYGYSDQVCRRCGNKDYPAAALTDHVFIDMTHTSTCGQPLYGCEFNPADPTLAVEVVACPNTGSSTVEPVFVPTIVEKKQHVTILVHATSLFLSRTAETHVGQRLDAQPSAMISLHSIPHAISAMGRQKLLRLTTTKHYRVMQFGQISIQQ
jgi:hypothetical protein